MEILALALPLVVVVVFGFTLRSDPPRASAPVLFGLIAAGALLVYITARDENLVPCLAALYGVGIAVAGLVAVILETDSWLAAAEADEPHIPTLLWRRSNRAHRWRKFEGDFRTHVAFLDWMAERHRGDHRRPRAERKGIPPVDGGASMPDAEALFSFQRKGRAALLVFVRRDRLGNLLEAAAYDPEEYM
jgi:hypothetical protein